MLHALVFNVTLGIVRNPFWFFIMSFPHSSSPVMGAFLVFFFHWHSYSILNIILTRNYLSQSLHIFHHATLVAEIEKLATYFELHFWLDFLQKDSKMCILPIAISLCIFMHFSLSAVIVTILFLGELQLLSKVSSLH